MPPKRKEERKTEEVTEDVGVYVFPDGSRYDGQFVRKTTTLEDGAADGHGARGGAGAGSDASQRGAGGGGGGGAAAAGRRSATPTQMTMLGDAPELASLMAPVVTVANGVTTSVVLYRHGHGVFIDGNTTYDGTWDLDRMHGFGRFATEGGATYTGYFWNNEFDGAGTYRWPDGSSYQGQWRANVMHGEGTFTDVSGTRWYGQFRNGKGQALVEVADGAPQTTAAKAGATPIAQ
jgi:hypothetical protein